MPGSKEVAKADIALASSTAGQFLKSQGPGAIPLATTDGSTLTGLTVSQVAGAAPLAGGTFTGPVTVTATTSVPGLIVKGVAGLAANYLEATPNGTTVPVAYISPTGELVTTGTAGAVKVYDRADNTKSFQFYASSNLFNIYHSVNGTIWSISSTGATTALGNVTATGSLACVGPTSQIGINRRDNNAQAGAIYSGAGGLNFYLNAAGGDVFVFDTAGKVTFSKKATIPCRDGAITAATDGATITFDCNLSDRHTVTLGGNRTLALSNDTVGQQVTLVLTQDGTGSRTVTWWAGIKWPGGAAPTLTTTAAHADVLTFLKLGSGSYLGFYPGANLF